METPQLIQVIISVLIAMGGSFSLGFLLGRDWKPSPKSPTNPNTDRDLTFVDLIDQQIIDYKVTKK